MERQDKDLAFMLQYENIAWFEDGKVRILDRRCYPREVRFVTCTHYGEVAKAIDGRTGYSMVKKSSKPLGDELRERDGGRRLWRLCLVLALAALAAEVALLKLNRTKTHA